MAHPETVAVKKWLAFGPLGTILGTGSLSILDSHRIQSTPNDMVANPREVLDTSTTNQDDGVFLKVVSDAGNVGSNFYPVRKPNTRNFTQSRIRFFGCRSVHPCTNTSALRAPL